MGDLGAETLGTVTFLVSVLVSEPVRPKMSGLEKFSVLRDFIKKPNLIPPHLLCDPGGALFPWNPAEPVHYGREDTLCDWI